MPAPVSGLRQIDEDYGEELGKAVRIPINILKRRLLHGGSSRIQDKDLLSSRGRTDSPAGIVT